MFRVPLKLYYNKYDTDLKKSESKETFGSYFGGCVTLISYLWLSVYFANMMQHTLKGDYDIINFTPMSNTFDEETRAV